MTADFHTNVLYSSTDERSKKGWSLETGLFLLVLAACLLAGPAGCVVGYRYDSVSDTVVNDSGQSSRVEGHGHVVYTGLILDFRVLRFSYPYVGGQYEIEASGPGAVSTDSQAYNTREQSFHLDVPLLSIWSEENGIGYPGTLEHRHSIDLWLSGTANFYGGPHGWVEGGLVWYKHDLMAVRLFGGWGETPVDVAVEMQRGDGTTSTAFFDSTAGGPSGGIEVTVLAGEQALDFLNWFAGQQDAAEEGPK